MKPFGSALIGVARRISRPEGREHTRRKLVLFGQQVRRYLASIEPLRNAWHFAIALRGEMYWRTYSQSQFAEYITKHGDDLWGYSTYAAAYNEQRFTAAIEMLSELDRNFE